MSVLQFIADVVKSLAWPVAVIVAVVVLRAKIGGALQTLASRIKTLKGGPVDSTFGAETAAAAAELADENLKAAVLGLTAIRPSDADSPEPNLTEGEVTFDGELKHSDQNGVDERAVEVQVAKIERAADVKARLELLSAEQDARFRESLSPQSRAVMKAATTGSETKLAAILEVLSRQLADTDAARSIKAAGDSLRDQVSDTAAGRSVDALNEGLQQSNRNRS